MRFLIALLLVLVATPLFARGNCYDKAYNGYSSAMVLEHCGRPTSREKIGIDTHGGNVVPGTNVVTEIQNIVVNRWVYVEDRGDSVLIFKNDKLDKRNYIPH